MRPEQEGGSHGEGAEPSRGAGHMEAGSIPCQQIRKRRYIDWGRLH